MKNLADIKSNDLEDYIFPGIDAAVLIINKRIELSELEDIFREVQCEHRFYPTDEGWNVKFPYSFIEGLMSEGECDLTLEDFYREPKGWYHEHCSFCNAYIEIGTLCYSTENKDGGIYIICKNCSKACNNKQHNKSLHPTANRARLCSVNDEITL